MFKYGYESDTEDGTWFNFDYDGVEYAAKQRLYYDGTYDIEVWPVNDATAQVEDEVQNFAEFTFENIFASKS